MASPKDEQAAEATPTRPTTVLVPAVAPMDIIAPVPETAILHSNTLRPEDDDADESDSLEHKSRLFPHPLDEDSFVQKRVTWREQYIRSFNSEVREKEDWATKMDDPEIWKKWVMEAKEQSSDDDGYDEAITACWTKECIDFAKKELESYREHLRSLDKEDGNGAIVPSIDCVWRSDGLIESDLRDKLLKQVVLLEDIPDEKKDWHPGSKNQVLDIVHPSLYPLVYNVTLDHSGAPIPSPTTSFKRSQIPEPTRGWRSRYDDEVNLPGYSSQFQWLPSVFSVGETGENVKIKSYINNLDTRQQKDEFYPILEQIFAKFVPMFENVLRDLAGKKYELRRVDESGGTYEADGYLNSSSPEYISKETYEKYEKAIWEPDGDHLILPGPSGKCNVKDEESYYEDDGVRIWNLGQLTGDLWKPTALGDELEKEVKLAGKDLKVIVKLANIILTPENPEYAGGSWHVEAMLNERIVSTGIYYYDQENVSPSSLFFRQVSESWDEDGYSAIGGDAARNVYRMAWEGPSDQEIGYIATEEERCIAFPNIFQHQVSPFKLDDETKPGYRKILVFFLCDPTAGDEIYDTSQIAPQNRSTAAVRDGLLRNAKILGSLPEDVFRLIIRQTPPAMTLEEAKKFREELMEERKAFNSNDRKVRGLNYSL